MPDTPFPLPGDRPQAETRTEQGETQGAVPRTPNERDESASNARHDDPSAARVGRLGTRDAERGVVDTSKGAETDATYERLREDLPDGEKKHRP